MERSFGTSEISSQALGLRRVAPSAPSTFLLDLTRLLLVPALVTLFLWWTSAQDVSLLQAACAWVLFCFTWGSYSSWKRQRRYDVPFLSLVAFMYWLFYGVALFWSDHYSTSALGREHKEVLPQELLTQGMLMAVVAVCCLWAGMRTPIGDKWMPRRIPNISLRSVGKNYLRFLLIIGGFFILLPQAGAALGEGGAQLISGLQDTVPLVAFIILFRQALRGQVGRFDKILLVFFFLTRFAAGIAGGIMVTVLATGMACLILYLSEKRRVPWLAFLPIFGYIIFFQAGKNDFRSESWGTRPELRGQDQRGGMEKIGRWVSLSMAAWERTLDDPTGESRKTLLENVLVRTSLLTSTAHVIDYTPRYVPYQNGSTYSYLVALWVPRALWPNKPSVSEANQFYQVAYGLTREEDLETVSIASGTMTESYINFGWVGVIAVMYGVGLLFNASQKLLLSRSSGLLLNAIGIVWVINFLGIEAQLAAYIGGLVQRTLLVLIVFAPIIRFRRLDLRNRKQSSSS